METQRGSKNAEDGRPPTEDLGDVYLKLFSTPVAANTEKTYKLMREITRAVLEGKSIHHAQAAVEAAWDEAAAQIDRWMSSGGQDRG